MGSPLLPIFNQFHNTYSLLYDPTILLHGTVLTICRGDIAGSCNYDINIIALYFKEKRKVHDDKDYVFMIWIA